MRSADLSGSKHHRSHTHKQKTLIDHMSEGMSNGSINCKFAAYSNSDHHKTNLIDFAVAKHAPKIIFDNS